MRLKLIHWNCRSFRANGHWIRSQFFSDSHVICLQETFLDSNVSVSVPHMRCYSYGRTGGRGGGLVTAVRASLPSYSLALPLDPSGAVECLGVNIFFNNSWFSIINVYLPRGVFPDAWFDDLLQLIEFPFLLVGDFNIDLLRTHPPFSSGVQRFHSWALNHNIYICNTTCPTRAVHGSPPTLLDLSLSSPALANVLTYYVHPDSFDSDHQPVAITVDDPSPTPVPGQRCSYVNWAKAGSLLESLLSSASSDPIHFDAFMAFCHRAISLSTFSLTQYRRRNAPWWDATCRRLLGLKRRYLRLARSSCSKVYWLLFKRTACQLRRYIKQVSRKYWDNVCWTSGSNGRIFKILKNLARKQSPLGDNVLWHSGPIASSRDQAGLFLQAFCQEDPLHPLPYDLSEGDSFLDSPFTLCELQSAIKNSRPTSPGRDGISVRLLQGLSLDGVRKLLGFFNNIFESAVLPSSWKEAAIVPICKPGKPSHLVSSYRPIALTPVLCKVFERVILHRLVSWAGRHNVFHPSHFGFMPFRDSTTALCKLYDDVSHARNSRLAVFAVCLDIRAAYDSIWIDGLIYKLAILGVRGKMGRWIASYLTFRSICIRWKSVFSDFGPCRRGVPQGSVLSPFLFMIFLADLFEILDPGVFLIIYADDIVLYALGDDPFRTLTKLQSCLDRIVQWCTAHHLSLSPEKCSAIDFSRRKTPEAVLKILGVDLEWCNVVKILGVWFGRSLMFNHHFSYLRTKAFKRMNYLKAIVSCSRGVSSAHMIKLVNSLIRSLMEYACPLFLKTCPSTINTLEVIQNAALRIATGLPKCTPIPLLRREANTSSVVNRLRCLTHRFFVRQLALPHSSFAVSAAASLGYLSSEAENFLTCYQIDPRDIIKFVWPAPSPASPRYQIITEGLPFQTCTLPANSVFQEWRSWVSSIPPCILIASDASKDASKTAVAAYNDAEKSCIAWLVPNSNSIFSAEAIAIYTALSTFVCNSNNYIILTDSLSVLRALQNVSYRSPRIILTLHNFICKVLTNDSISLSLVWCPGHQGIPPNEAADSFARNGPYKTYSLRWIAPEDIVSQIRRDWQTESVYEWMNSDYYQNFTHLNIPFTPGQWTDNRQEDVWISRWRTRMLMTNNRLYRMKLVPSPLCTLCCVIETPDHILLHCGKYDDARRVLFSALDLPGQSVYSDVIAGALSSRKGIRALVRFSASVTSS